MTEETVEERRERLKALREAQNLLSSSESGSQPTPPPTVLPPPSDESSLQPEQEHEDNEDAKQDMKFRNYLPRDKALQNSRIAPPALPKFEDPVAASAVAENAKEVLTNSREMFLLSKKGFTVNMPIFCILLLCMNLSRTPL
eukprot:TRINITY_DN2010_c0_g1_i1.p1 TRINITY_DN2010_c0_g1~~TRINITY_DN2010_c0_g1_i1.p1  ORF type:complete len:142 (+),score=33.87 TRINITY_DN2010_c0_g1_i1:137-562(+)